MLVVGDYQPHERPVFRWPEEVTVHKRKDETWVSLYWLIFHFWLKKCSELLSVFLLGQQMNYMAGPLIIYKKGHSTPKRAKSAAQKK